MAIFGSTTLGSSYSDPMRALTIKALEKRQADMMAQQAQQGMPDSIPTPIQGVGHVVNQLANQMQLGRVEQATAARREELARVMAEGPKGPDGTWSPQQIAAITGANEELGGKLIQNDYSAREARAGREHDVTRDTARFGHQDQTAAARVEAEKAAAAEAARVASEGRAQESGLIAGREQAKESRAEERLKTTFKGDVGDQIHNLDVLLGKGQITPEQHAAQRDALLQKAATPKIEPNVIKGRAEAEKAYTQSQVAISDLKRARDAFAHPEGTYTGAMQNIAPGASTIPGSGYLLDKPKAERTALINNVLSKISTGTMAETLKGSSTNFEMQKFEKIFNDPAISPQDKMIAFDNLIKVAEADLATEGSQIKALGGTARTIDEAPAGAGAGAPTRAGASAEDEAAKAWLADPKNANHPAREGVMKRLGGK